MMSEYQDQLLDASVSASPSPPLSSVAHVCPLVVVVMALGRAAAAATAAVGFVVVADFVA